MQSTPPQLQLEICNCQHKAKPWQKGGSLGWVCNEVCNAYVMRSVTKQSKAQYATSAAPASPITRCDGYVTRSVTSPGRSWVCNEVCNSSVTRQSKGQYLKHVQPDCRFNASQAAPKRGAAARSIPFQPCKPLDQPCKPLELCANLSAQVALCKLPCASCSAQVAPCKLPQAVMAMQRGL